jgi:glycosyltransferase involved in cell wall biosynthesis
MPETIIWVNARFLTRKTTGVERVALELLRALAENWLDASGKVSHEGQRYQFKLLLDQVSTVTIPNFLSGWETKRIGRFSGHAWEQIDLAFFKPKNLMLSLCNTGPIFRQNHILFIHDAQVFAIPKNFDWKFRWWYRTLLLIASRSAKLMLTNSVFSQQQLSHYLKIDQQKLTVIHLGCDHMLRFNDKALIAPINHLGGKPYVLAVSSLSTNKNFTGVIAALNLLGGHAPHCVIVGQQYSKVFKGIRQSDENATAVGYVTDEQLANLYKGASALIYPSFYEGFGLPPLEAMMMGCPVIVSRTSSLPEICSTMGIYCDPSDPASIAQAIQTAMQKTPLNNTDRLQYKNYAQAFTWKKSATKLLDALTALPK